ncbi:cytochrome c oxidase subunit 3 family protein [bacterium]|nr:cytochrome c oxidase subunit 3 family protein [bacterium]
MVEPAPARQIAKDSIPHHDEHSDPVGAKMGMWLFLFTEIVLFGGMFLLYTMYLTRYRNSFIQCSEELSLPSGVANTILLLTSSLTVAMSITALRRNRRRASMLLLAGTLVCAVGFFVIKYFEWAHKFHLGIYPNSPQLIQLGFGTTMYYGLYFVMTGLHALHVLIGVAVLAVMLVMVYRGSINPERYIALENGGLYWHLVDLVWIFLFPLFYLVT